MLAGLLGAPGVGAGSSATVLAAQGAGTVASEPAAPSELREQLARAEQALAGGDPQTALELLAEIEHAAPDAVLLPGARALLQLGAYESALEKLATASERFPEAVEPRLIHALVLRDLGRIEAAIEVLQRAVGDFPGDLRVAEQLALMQLSRGLDSAALGTAEGALQSSGRETALLRLAAGAAAARSSDPALRERAVTHLRRAIELDPPDPGRAHLELGSLLAASGRHEEALPHLQQAVEALPDSADASFRLATSLRAVDRVEEASEAVARFRELSSSAQQQEERAREAGIALNEAQQLARENRLEDAALRAEEILAEYPDHPHTLLLLAKVRASQQRLDEAAELLAAAREQLPGEVEVHLLEGVVLRRSGRNAAARRALERAILLDPGLGEAHAVLGGIHLEQGDAAAAVASLRQALALGIDGVQLRTALARALEAVGEPAASREQLRLAEELRGEEGGGDREPPLHRR
ncbi:MAG: tetratricopeptide repeat protein [Acidobacteria bacterium]|nr:MAG: tetratricopeptide repeat protein [Acidobacteriota bacterium]